MQEVQYEVSNIDMIEKTILIADDDEAILDAMEIMLTGEGYSVVAESDGNKLFDLKKPYPDLILLDIWMSGVDGKDICLHIKSDANTKHIPIVMVSANRDTAKIAKEAGANDFLAKPFEMEELLKKIRKFTGF